MILSALTFKGVNQEVVHWIQNHWRAQSVSRSGAPQSCEMSNPVEEVVPNTFFHPIFVRAWTLQGETVSSQYRCVLGHCQMYWSGLAVAVCWLFPIYCHQLAIDDVQGIYWYIDDGILKLGRRSLFSQTLHQKTQWWCILFGFFHFLIVLSSLTSELIACLRSNSLTLRRCSIFLEKV